VTETTEHFDGVRTQTVCSNELRFSFSWK